MIKQLADGLHRTLARAPSSLARAYIELIARCSRMMLSEPLTARIHNSISRHTWPEMRFSAREVIVGENTRINIHPHLGEFDDVALFSRRLRYEDSSFRWLEANAADRYDLIIEIGMRERIALDLITPSFA